LQAKVSSLRSTPDRHRICAQENVEFAIGNTLTIRIDMTITDVTSGQTRDVLNTAALIYPTPVGRAVRGDPPRLRMAFAVVRGST
jgi:hypothetical protein